MQSPHMFVAGFEKQTVAQDYELRKTIRGAGGDYQVVPKTAIELKAGRHRICWATDCKIVQVVAGQEQQLMIPVSLSLQLHTLARTALDTNKLAAAKERIERLSEMQRKRALSSDQLAWLSYYRGRFEFARGDFSEALQHYNESLDHPEGPKTAAVHRLAHEAARRVPTACILVLSVEDESHRCHRTVRYYPEGKVTYHVLGSSDRTINLQLGPPRIVSHCQVAPQ